jgi:hypothetical protein
MKGGICQGGKMKYLKKILKFLRRLWEETDFIFGLTDEGRKKQVDLGLVDYSGQGRDKYGR